MSVPLTPSRPRGRLLLTALYDAAVGGADPGPLTAAAVQQLEAPTSGRVWLFAVGKAAAPMAASAVAELRRSLREIAGGVIVAPEPGASPFPTVASVVGDHPLPARNSFTAAQRVGETTARVRSGDSVIVLLSGGTSSLIAAPLRGFAESDLRQLFERLMSSGLDIHAMNAVRKRFSRWGAGRLAVALAPARSHVLVMSDVPGDDPASVGSGPCSPDPFTVREVVALLDRVGLRERIAPAMRDYLTGVVRGLVPETPKASHPAFAHVTTRVIGTNHLALSAAAARARELAVIAEAAPMPLQGEAASCGTRIAQSLLQRAAREETGCLLWGGETTVKMSDAPAAAGGRCQELALAASRALAGGGEPARRITLLAAGTDGRDGPTDAAGAFADAGVWRAIEQSGRDPERSLARHEAYAALDAAGALLRRRPTGTNVMDVVIGLIE
jgi:hydroxypyruvate reductase